MQRKSATIGVHTANNQVYCLNLTLQSFIYLFINDSIISLFVSAATEDRVRCPAIPAAEESNRED